MAKQEIRKHGPVTDYRPDEDDVKGGGAAGRVDDLSKGTGRPKS